MLPKMKPDFHPLVAAERRLQSGLSRLPAWISRWFGYSKEDLSPAPSWVVCLWGLIASTGVIALLGFLMGLIAEYELFLAAVPMAFAGSAVLCYGPIDSPLAQPRALVFGHFFSAIVGEIFREILDASHAHFQYRIETYWVIPALTVGISLVVMHITNTMHPPAGVTAVLPLINSQIRYLRWGYLALVLLSSAIVLVVALLINNIQRQYPLYWFAPIPPTPTVLSDQHRHRTPPPATSEEARSEPRRHHNLHDLESGK